ncbi:alpha/beta fold hydrolase [Hyalangium rubrum]|uniref:Alpha/beta hydrolase n=1 Tax=Hyalangium rubrum TaxID=3103134 RepID=A0ABU5HB19_9BACT|nr:alpha/beta hydrolase [Hyalangium sp. s54d21]MDY7230289.1 alpha/beta hydrolase [Hyalangium sp. s54d21]
MPHIRIHGAQLYYEEHGAGTDTIVFSHGLLWSGEMFREQVAVLKDRYRVITFDHRGQGRSEKTADRLDMDSLAEDAAELIRQRSPDKPVHFVGLSMGGFVAMRLAARHPELLKSCILMETSADPEPAENKPRYRQLSWVVRLLGARLVVSKVMRIMFGQSFLTDPARAELRREWEGRLAGLERNIHRAVTGVIDRSSIHEELKNIRCPTLVLVGEEDVATVPAKAERIHQAIAGSELVRIPRAGHTSTIENPSDVNRALLDFLARKFA